MTRLATQLLCLPAREDRERCAVTDGLRCLCVPQVSVLPFDLIGSMSNSGFINKLQGLRIIRLLRLVKLVRIAKASR